MDPEIIAELNARADAGQKLGMVAIEMVINLAASLGKDVDLRGAASAFENHEVVDTLDAAKFDLEKRARKRVAEVLRLMADAQGK